jgi:hypothetical protein
MRLSLVMHVSQKLIHFIILIQGQAPTDVLTCLLVIVVVYVLDIEYITEPL